ncbi:MAG: hypothetical protein AAFZ87_03635 [Planctomycetota bacterium]
MRSTLALLALAAPASAQTLDPPFITSIGGPLCGGGSNVQNVSITLPGSSSSGRIDVFLLFDDTGSFSDEAPQVIAVFRRVVARLQELVPTADIAYGVGRFEDYGGPATGFSNENPTGRPFILNQAILSRAEPTFLADLDAALANTAPGFGGDGPETSAGEALFQLATGAGFDGNGNGSSLDSGLAGSLDAQINPGLSGDVPPYSSYVGSGSGSQGGGGFRENSLRIVILATDIAPVAPYDPSMPIPDQIVGTGSSEPTTAFTSAFSVGGSRFGFVSDALSFAANTVANAIAPRGSATIPQSVAAANGAGLRVIGLTPFGAPTDAPGPSSDPSVFLSALARLTGAVDDTGTPLVFNIQGGTNAIAQSIVEAVFVLAQVDLDLELTAEDLPPGVTVDVNPAVVTGVEPGETATFEVTFSSTAAFGGGAFDLVYRDQSSGAVSGSLPVTLECLDGCTVIDFESLAAVGSPPNGLDLLGMNIGSGITVQGSSASGFGPAIFDTSPMGPNAASSDPDLLVSSGNAVILQENGASSSGVFTQPDDDEFGGVMVFEFDQPVEICAIDLIDFDVLDAGNSRVELVDSAGRVRTVAVPAGFTEDIDQMSGSGIRRLGLGTTAPQQGFLSIALGNQDDGFDEGQVDVLRIVLGGSGAVDNLTFRPAAAPFGGPFGGAFQAAGRRSRRP